MDKETMLRICRDCNHPFDDEHISHDGDCQCPKTNEFTGSWRDVGYNEAILEVYNMLVSKSAAEVLLSNDISNV